jgi:hypothetical protein
MILAGPCFSAVDPLGFIADSSMVGYDGGQHARDEELAVERKKPARKREPRPEKGSRWGLRGMTVRDWLPIVGALLIPLAVAAGTWWITWQQGRIADQRAEADRELAEQRAQDEALQAYLNQMSSFLLEKDLRLSTRDNATEDSKEARNLARARTLTVLRTLDSRRKEQVMQFLMEAALVQTVGGKPIVELSGAYLNNTDLVTADLGGAELSDAKLISANLSDANLEGTQDVSDEQLAEAKSLTGATMPNGQEYEDWLKSKSSREDGENGSSS